MTDTSHTDTSYTDEALARALKGAGYELDAYGVYDEVLRFYVSFMDYEAALGAASRFMAARRTF